MAHTLKAFTSGTHRIVNPTAMLERVKPLLPRAGVTRLANITGLDRIGVPTVSAVRPNARTLSVAAGKGLSLDAAMASAAMEAIELFHAEVPRPADAHCAYAELLAHQLDVVDPQALPRAPHAVFDANRRRSWIFGEDLANDNRATAVPAELVTLAEPEAAPPLGRAIIQSSNGLASGAVKAEALLAGLLEVVERDAVARARDEARRSGLGPRRVDLTRLSPDWPLVRDVLDRLADARVRPIVYDCTPSSGIAVYLARVWDEIQPGIGIFFGSGAHLDPEIAMLRALTEAVQSRAVYTAGARDDVSSRQYQQFKSQASPAVIASLERELASVDPGQPQSSASATFEADIQLIVDRLKADGLPQVAVVDLTLPEYRDTLSVIRVVVPGLRFAV